MDELAGEPDQLFRSRFHEESEAAETAPDKDDGDYLAQRAHRVLWATDLWLQTALETS